jgi:hypothetical protein
VNGNTKTVTISVPCKRLTITLMPILIGCNQGEKTFGISVLSFRVGAFNPESNYLP